jgi:hypothetical protein
MSDQEQDLRVGILNALLTTPHRDLEKIHPIHQELIGKDPRFYVRLAAWYNDRGDVRDHKEMFIVNLVLSDFEGHREVGLAMLRELPPYQVVRVVDFISGRKKTRKVRVGEEPQALKQAGRRQRRSIAQRLFGTAPHQPQPANEVREPDKVTVETGLFRNVPRAVKTEIARYLREREADAEWFDGSVLSARKAMKRLYALLHVRPGERAQRILFEDNPPPDSRLFALRELAAATSPAEQAKAIVEHRIPYRVASTVVRQMTPSVLVALINQMSPQELINSLGALRRRRALELPEIQALVEDKLNEAKSAGRISALKAGQAIGAAGVSDELRQQLEDVADMQVKAKGRISRPTALLIDKSASMEMAIELGKQIGALISAICEKELYTYTFDTMAYEITPQGNRLADWERALKGIAAGNATSGGVALRYLTKKKQYVEQIILITDEQENTPPGFVEALREYTAQLKSQPAVCIVRTAGGSDLIERQCKAAGMEVDVFQFIGDYYALPNLVPMLARPSKLELLMEIMDYPLPVRKPA